MIRGESYSYYRDESILRQCIAAKPYKKRLISKLFSHYYIVQTYHRLTNLKAYLNISICEIVVLQIHGHLHICPFKLEITSLRLED